MAETSIEFASLLCSRLCHDLLSPVGAMNNGLELLADEDDPAMRASCLELLADSARSAAEKLKFFRLAFGAAGGFGEEIATSELKAAIEGLLLGNKRIVLGWIVDVTAMPKPVAKILLNLAMIAIETLIRGGRLDIAVEGPEVVVRAEGARLVLDAEVKAVLTGSTGAPTARTAQAWLARMLASEVGGRIALGDGEEGVLLFGASVPA
jgi:histidine phosphotransferase ChpT